MKTPTPQKRSKYTNLPFSKSTDKKINLGSAYVKRRPITLAKVNLKEYEEDK